MNECDTRTHTHTHCNSEHIPELAGDSGISMLSAYGPLLSDLGQWVYCPGQSQSEI